MTDLTFEEIDCMIDSIHEQGTAWRKIFAEEKFALTSWQETVYQKYLVDEIFRNLRLLGENEEDLKVWTDLKKSVILTFLKKPPVTTTHLGNRLIKAHFHPTSEELKEWIELDPEYAYSVLEDFFPDPKDSFTTFAAIEALAPSQRIQLYEQYQKICSLIY